MRYARLTSLMTLGLLVSFFSVPTATANSELDRADSNVRARVARITFLSGDVQVLRLGSNEWEGAEVNLPLVEGDKLATGSDSRLEVQIDAYNFVRLDENSLLTVVTLRDEGIALSLSEGTATLRLSRFDGKREYFEVDAPKTTIAAENRGLYRIDAGQPGNTNADVRVTVREGGRARIYSESSGFTLRDGRTARLFFESADSSGASGDWDLASALSLDEWDRWVDQREYSLAQRLRYEQRERYYDSSVWGAEELDGYGDWVSTDSYGYVWRPHVTVINNYHNWAPYRYGRWRWVRPYGWVWVGGEPWGWAPYHYGRWVYYNGSWCWSPRNHYGYGYGWWHPSLVVFVTINNSVCWYPLPYHYSTPVYTGPIHPPIRTHETGGIKPIRQETGGIKPIRGQTGGINPIPGLASQVDQVTPDTKDTTGSIKNGPPDKAYLAAVSSVEIKEFGTTKATTRHTPISIAQTVIKSAPVAVDNLPVKQPASGIIAGPEKSPGEGPGRTRVGGDKNAMLNTPATGATLRKPGVALNDELRRTRVLNGREPIVKPDRSTNETVSTGAVIRPTRTNVKAASEGAIESSNSGNAPVRPIRPITPVKTNDSQNEPVRPIRNPNVYSPPSEAPSKPPQTREPRQNPPEPVRSEPVRQPPVRHEPAPPQSAPPSAPPPSKPAEQRRQDPSPPPPPAKKPDVQRSDTKSGKG